MTKTLRSNSLLTMLLHVIGCGRVQYYPEPESGTSRVGTEEDWEAASLLRRCKFDSTLGHPIINISETPQTPKDSTPQPTTMIGSVKLFSKAAGRAGAQLQQKSAMSTIILPDLAFDYGALEPVVRSYANSLTITKFS